MAATEATVQMALETMEATAAMAATEGTVAASITSLART
jgi:hypothetical protein